MRFFSHRNGFSTQQSGLLPEHCPLVPESFEPNTKVATLLNYPPDFIDPHVRGSESRDDKIEVGFVELGNGALKRAKTLETYLGLLLQIEGRPQAVIHVKRHGSMLVHDAPAVAAVCKAVRCSHLEVDGMARASLRSLHA